MSKKPMIIAANAAGWVKDGDTTTTSGFVVSAMPEVLARASEAKSLETGSPKSLTLFYVAAQGNRDGSGADHPAHEGMIRYVIGGHWNVVSKLSELVLQNKIEGYNLLQGTLSQPYRDIVGHRIDTITHVGLNTSAGPRLEGGKLNDVTREDLVEVMEIPGQEKLLYKAIPLNIDFIRGIYADENGNVIVSHEVASIKAASTAQAVHNRGGEATVQVERAAENGSLDPKLVKIPGIYIGTIVVAQNPSEHEQCVGRGYDGSMSGEYRVPLDSLDHPSMSVKKIIGRRAAMELIPNSIVSLEIGIPEYISMVANEEGISDYMTFTVESGPVGDVSQGGPKFGGSINAETILDQSYQFDLYDGGGVDYAFLGLAQTGRFGDINASKFGPGIVGCGGFINITQNAKKVFFCGTFTAGGLKTHVGNGKLVIDQEGKEKKFTDRVEQITLSGVYAQKVSQPVLYITEHAIFELRSDGVFLTGVVPGIDVQTQIFDLMDFQPRIGNCLTDARIFPGSLMGLK